jgi:hypothetical protein
MQHARATPTRRGNGRAWDEPPQQRAPVQLELELLDDGARGRRRGSRLSMKERSGAGAAGCSSERRGAAGPDAPLAARHFAALVRRGGSGELPANVVASAGFRSTPGGCSGGGWGGEEGSPGGRT